MLPRSPRRIEQCPNFPKSKPCAAACSRPWKASASSRSRCAAAICAGRCRKILPQRLKGKTVTGLGRRAKYLLADLSSGDVLLMHLGMSGSFHVSREQRQACSAAIITSATKHAAHDHVVFHMSSGADRDLQRSAPLRLDEARRARQARCRAAVEGARPRAARQCIRRRDAGARLPGQEDKPQSGAARPAHRRRARQYLCLRGAVSRAAVAETPGLDHRRPERRAERARRTAGRQPSKRCCNAAIKAGGSSLRDHRLTDGDLGMFQHNFQVYDREGEPCRTPGCRGTVKRIVQNGRSTFYCPACQK